MHKKRILSKVNTVGCNSASSIVSSIFLSLTPSPWTSSPCADILKGDTLGTLGYAESRPRSAGRRKTDAERPPCVEKIPFEMAKKKWNTDNFSFLKAHRVNTKPLTSSANPLQSIDRHCTARPVTDYPYSWQTTSTVTQVTSDHSIFYPTPPPRRRNFLRG